MISVMSNNKRLEWIDYARGIGIILVVYAHLLSSAFRAGIPINPNFYAISDSVIYSFHMPLFFFLSGIFVTKSITRRGIKGFVIQKSYLLLYPYCIWSLIQGGIEIFFADQSSRGMTYDQLAAIPFLPIGHFWFVYALFLMFLLIALSRLLKSYGVAGAICLAVIVFFFPLQTDIMALGGFSTGFLYFVIGYLLFGMVMDKIESFLSNAIVGSLVFSFILVHCFLFTVILEPVRLTTGDYPLLFFPAAFLGIFSCIGISCLFARYNLFTFIKTCGVYSLEIYLAHMVAGVGMRVVLLSLFSITDPIVHMVGGVTAGLVFPIVICLAGQYIQFPYLFSIQKSQIKLQRT